MQMEAANDEPPHLNLHCLPSVNSNTILHGQLFLKFGKSKFCHLLFLHFKVNVLAMANNGT